jgi:uncharacterized repeat protein (TIGR01451 family)
MKSFLLSLRKLDSPAKLLRDRIAASEQPKLFTTLLLSSAMGLMASALPALAGTNISSTPSVSETGEAIGYTVDAVSLSNSYGTTVCTLTSTRNFNITLPTGATVRKAILYWATDLTAGDAQVSLAGSTINASQNWNDTILTTTKTYNGYRADVTSNITGAGSYSFSGLSSAPNSSPFNGGCLSGASLIVIYDTTRSDPNALNRIEMFDGFEGIRGAGLASGGASSTVTLPINSLGSDLSFMTALSWQGNFISEPPSNNGYPDSLTVNGTAVSNPNNPVNDNGNGSGANQAQSSVYAVDADTYDISNITSAGPTSLIITNASGNFDYVISQGFIFGSRGPDVSDAPNSGGFSYGIARHRIVPTLLNPSLYLGSKVDGEVVDTVYAGNINADFDNTNGANDDDGISSFPTLTAGAASYSIPTANITATGTGTLHAWIDFNKNGTFDVGEHASVAITSNTPAGSLNWTGITTGATGNTYARFRFTSDATVTASTPSGIASNGEVEDYRVSINPGAPLICPTELLGNWSRNSTVTPNRNELYKINPSNGAAITPKIADTNWTSGSGVEPNGRYLFYVDRTTSPNPVRRLDLVTLTDIDTGYTVPATGLRVAVHPTDGHLYILNGAAGPITLFKAPYASVPVAAGTAMSAVGTLTDDPDNGTANAINLISGGDIAFDKLGNLYLIEQGRRIFSVNASLKAIYLNTLSVSGLTPSPAGLAFVGGQLYAGDSASPGNLYLLNLVDNSIETKGAAGIPILSAGYWGDLASCQYPEPKVVADKTVTKIGGSSGTTIQPGDTLEYTITVRNESKIYTVDVRFSDAIPANTTYVASSTTVNYNAGTATDFEALADVSGVMPFAVSGGAEIKTFGRSSGVLQPDDDTTINAEAVIKFQVKVNTTNPPTQVSNQGTVSYPNPSTGVDESIKTDDPSTTNVPLDPTIVPVQASVSNPNILLVKRITAVTGSSAIQGGDNVALYKDENGTPSGAFNNPYDDNDITITAPTAQIPADTDKWPNPSTFLIGAVNGGNVGPKDEVEYTIYFLSAGSVPASAVTFCDRIPANQTFIPNAFNILAQAPGGNLTDRGIAVSYAGNYQGYTNLPDGDTAQYYTPGSVLPGACGAAANTTGAVVVNLGTGATNAAGGTVPNATAPGTPADSYGFVRFKAKTN